MYLTWESAPPVLLRLCCAQEYNRNYTFINRAILIPVALPDAGTIFFGAGGCVNFFVVALTVQTYTARENTVW